MTTPPALLFHLLCEASSSITLKCTPVPGTRRLLLSGTPIQNDVLEMWSLFDFLMPGFLGPERAFRAKFGKALQVGCAQWSRGSTYDPRDSKASC